MGPRPTAVLGACLLLAASGCGGGGSSRAAARPSATSPAPSPSAATPSASPSPSAPAPTTGGQLTPSAARTRLRQLALTPAQLPGFAKDGGNDTSLDTLSFDFCNRDDWKSDNARVAQLDHSLTDDDREASVDETLVLYPSQHVSQAVAEFTASIAQCHTPYTRVDDDGNGLKITIEQRNNLRLPGVVGSVLELARMQGVDDWSQSVLVQRGDEVAIEAVESSSRSGAIAAATEVVRAVQGGPAAPVGGTSA